MEKRIYIVGARGQLGLALCHRYPNAVGLGRHHLDIGNRTAVMGFDWSGCKLLINAAAYTDVDGAETPEGRIDAWVSNAKAVSFLALAAKDNGFPLFHVSSEYVFDGRQSLHLEDEPLSPLGVYGQTKAAGEIATQTTDYHFIIRTSWLVGEGKNFVRIMMMRAFQNLPSTVVNDQIGRLTFTSTLVSAIDHIINSDVGYGLYNVTNNGESASWAEIAQLVYRQMGRSAKMVVPVSTAEYYQGRIGVAPRPLQSTLDLRKITTAGFMPPSWREELERYIAHAVDGL